MENKKLPASYRIALGQIKRYFGDSKPTEKEVKKIAVEIAKRNKLDDTEFFMKWSLGQIGTVNEDLDEDLDEATWDDAKDAVHDLANIFKRGKSRVTSNNSINIEVRGIVGKVVFDPSFKL